MPIPKRLYHYTSRESLLEGILPANRLRVGSLQFTNDPRENRPQGLAVFTRMQAETDQTRMDNALVRVQREFARILFKEWHVLCLTMTANVELPQGGFNKDIVERFRNGWARARMWAQYSNNHTGACLELDGSRLFESLKKSLTDEETIYHGPVEYTDGKSDELWAYQLDAIRNQPGIEAWTDELTTTLIRTHCKTHFDKLFLRKFNDWSAESEYRFLVNSARPSPLDIDLSGVLLDVIVGSEFHKGYVPSVKHFCKELKVSMSRLGWQARRPVREVLPI